MRDLRGMSGPFGAGRGRNGCASGVGRREGAKWLPEGCLPLQAGVTRGRSPAKVSAWVGFTLHQCKIYPAFGPRKGPCQPRGHVVILGAMKGPRKPLAKIEGRKRMQQSGLTVAWHGTRSRKDWAAYVENGSEQGRLVLAEQVSERAVKSLLARIQSLSRDALEAMGRPVEAVAAQGGGPPPRRPRGDAEAYEGTPSIFVTGWFRATLVLIVLAIVVVITVPWLMDFLDGGAREPRPPVRNEAPPASPNPIPGGR